MKIMITAGGTRERIDNVRSITNSSTGLLGSLIADAFAHTGQITKIYYICSRGAALPALLYAGGRFSCVSCVASCDGKTCRMQQKNRPLVSVIYAEDVADLERAVLEVAGTEEIDIIVHSMAVSDYRVKTVTSMELLTQALKAQPALAEGTSSDEWFAAAGSVVGDSGKISSGIDDMILWMERTPKIISLFQTLMPRAVLVGFKLLDNVSLETLIDAAHRLLTDNKCDYVLANDMADIEEGHHIGYLVDAEGHFAEYMTKEEIADAVVSAAVRARKER